MVACLGALAVLCFLRYRIPAVLAFTTRIGLEPYLTTFWDNIISAVSGNPGAALSAIMGGASATTFLVKRVVDTRKNLTSQFTGQIQQITDTASTMQSELKGQLSSIEGQRSQLESTLSTTQGQLLESVKEVENLKSQYSQLSEERRLLDSKLQTLSQSKTRLEIENQELRAALEDLKTPTKN